jgi:enoyl-CoA hydratase/carnithine racemase
MSVWEVEEHDGIVAAHNNPPMNYFIGDSATGLAEMLPRWREDDVRVVIITGAIPDKYITHYSVEELVELAEDRESLVRFRAGGTGLVLLWRAGRSSSPTEPRGWKLAAALTPPAYIAWSVWLILVGITLV